MKIEQLKEVATPEEMRAEIFRLRRYDPMVAKVMDMADYRGLSAEDRYTALAYYAMRTLLAANQRALDDAMTRLEPLMIMTPNEEYAPLAGLCPKS